MMPVTDGRVWDSRISGEHTTCHSGLDLKDPGRMVGKSLGGGLGLECLLRLRRSLSIIVSVCVRETRSSQTDEDHLVFWVHSRRQL